MARILAGTKEIWSQELVSSKWLVKVIGVGSFIILTTLGAYVWIPLPFTPVPLTLQTFFVLLSGAVLGGNLGALSQFGYWIIGGLGLPFFAGASFGVSSLIGPSGGYLLGFILASWITGWLLNKKKASYSGLFWIFLLANSLLLLLGAGWLAILLGCSIKKAIYLGILPFIPGDIVKIVFATLVYGKIQYRVKNLFK